MSNETEQRQEQYKMTITLDTEQVSCLIQTLMRHCRHDQLSVIKEFRDITGVGLEEAMRLIQTASRER